MAFRPFESYTHRLHEFVVHDGEVCPEQARPFVLTAAILATGLAYIDTTLVGIAVPALQSDFQATIIDAQWVTNAYALILGALILVGGGIGDRIGRRRIFLVGCVIFAIASIACALAWSVEILISARVVQGIGAAALVPQSLALISANFPKDIRGKAIGTWAAASALAVAIGPAIGGFLIDLGSWRAAFWINVPVIAVVVWMTTVYVKESRDETQTGRIDWTGAVLAMAGFGALTFGLTSLSNDSIGGGLTTVWIIAGLAAIVAFVFAEGRIREPLVSLDLFRSPVFSGVNVATAFLYGAMTAVLFLVPFDMLARRGLSAGDAGLLVLPFGLIIAVASRFTGDLADKHGPRPFLVAGPLMFAVGVVGFTTASNVWVTILIPWIITGAAMGLVAAPLSTAVMNAAPEEKAGAASGISNTASRLSGVMAVAVLGALSAILYGLQVPGGTFGLLPPVGDESRGAAEAAFLSAYNTTMYVAAGSCLIAAIVSWFSLAGTGPAKPPAEGASDAEVPPGEQAA